MEDLVTSLKLFNCIAFIHFTSFCSVGFGRFAYSIFDVVAISETWTKTDYIHYELPVHYFMLIDMESKEELHYISIIDLILHQRCISCCEIITLNICLHNDKKIIISCCYRVPQSDMTIFYR